jgi:hypothetical protein
MELTTLDRISSAEEAGRFRDQSEDVISSSSPVDRNAKNRRTQQVICTGAAPGILSAASGAFMMTQDKAKVFRLFDALSQEVLWMCDSRKALKLIEYCHMSNKIVAFVSVCRKPKIKGYQLAVWDLNRGNVLLLPKVRQLLTVQCINQAGTRMIVSEGWKHCTMFDMDIGSKLFRFQLNSMYAHDACCFTHDDSKVAVACIMLNTEHFALGVWEVAPTSNLLNTLSVDLKSPLGDPRIASSFNSQMLAVAFVSEIIIVDLSSGGHSVLPVATKAWCSICFGCDDSCVVTLCRGGCCGALVAVYRIADGGTVFHVPLRTYRAEFGCLLCSNASKIFLAVGDDDFATVAYVFDYATGTLLQQSSGYDHYVARMYVPEPVMILM